MPSAPSRKNKVLFLSLAIGLVLPAVGFADTSGVFPYIIGERAEKEIIYSCSLDKAWAALVGAAEFVREETRKTEAKVLLSSMEIYQDRQSGMLIFTESRRKGSGPRDERGFLVLTFLLEPLDENRTKVRVHGVLRSYRFAQPSWGFTIPHKNKILERAGGLMKETDVGE
jgi:hypothetical protein